MAEKQSLLELLRAKHGADFHPAILLADVVADTTQDLKLRVDCSKTLMPYIEATKKAVEVKGELNGNVGLLRVSMVTEEVTGGDKAD